MINRKSKCDHPETSGGEQVEAESVIINMCVLYAIGNTDITYLHKARIK